MDTTRVPKQKRSIEKKQAIIKAAYQLFSEQGMQATSMKDIAELADVSIGSIYAYFADKKAIFLDLLDLFSKELQDTLETESHAIEAAENLDDLLGNILALMAQSHLLITQKFHDEYMVLVYADEEVRQRYVAATQNTAAFLGKALASKGYILSHPLEQNYLLFSLIENYNDVIAFNSRPDLDKTVLETQLRAILKQFILAEKHK